MEIWVDAVGLEAAEFSEKAPSIQVLREALRVYLLQQESQLLEGGRCL